jgi:hypothetical protein
MAVGVASESASNGSLLYIQTLKCSTWQSHQPSQGLLQVVEIETKILTTMLVSEMKLTFDARKAMSYFRTTTSFTVDLREEYQSLEREFLQRPHTMPFLL